MDVDLGSTYGRCSPDVSTSVLEIFKRQEQFSDCLMTRRISQKKNMEKWIKTTPSSLILLESVSERRWCRMYIFSVRAVTGWLLYLLRMPKSLKLHTELHQYFASLFFKIIKCKYHFLYCGSLGTWDRREICTCSLNISSNISNYISLVQFGMKYPWNKSPAQVKIEPVS